MGYRLALSRVVGHPSAGILALAAGALLVHGYHLGVDDAEIYLPAIKRAADPRLFPFASEFFMTHAHLSFFPNLVGGFARLAHLPADAAILLWHVAGIYLLLLAAWTLARACFESAPARWGAVTLLAAALSTPVAGTALAIFDPYVTARTLSAPATLFAVACWLGEQRKRAMGWLLVTALVHPQMSVYGAALIAGLALERKFSMLRAEAAAFSVSLPFLWGFGPATGAAREALLSRTYFFISKWAWYEMLGIIAPLGLLAWFAFRRPRGTTAAFQRLARTLVPFGLLFTAAAVLLNSTANLENFERLQPMRSFHLIYMIFFVLLGGLTGEFVLRRSARRWAALFVPLAAGIWILQAVSYPFSPHVEWPGSDGGNRWVAAFLWIRGNTPKNAVFALDPNYMAAAGDDQHGFRAVAERSALADNVKDSGAVSLFPQLAEEWKSQVLAQTGWAGFDLADFRRLARQYPVTWIVSRQPSPAGLRCPYHNSELAVCRINAGALTRNLLPPVAQSGR
jgi:hypothetical protein